MTRTCYYWGYQDSASFRDGNYSHRIVRFLHVYKTEEGAWAPVYRGSFEVRWQANPDSPNDWYGPHISSAEIGSSVAKAIKKLSDAGVSTLMPDGAIATLKAFPIEYTDRGFYERKVT